MPRSQPVQYPGRDQASSQRKAIVRIDRDAGAGLLRINLSDDYAPARVFAVDYVDVHANVDGVGILFGQTSPLQSSAARLHYVIGVTFPNIQFYNQLYRSTLAPSEPGKPLFIDSVKQSIEKNCYSLIEKMPDVSEQIDVKLGTGRSNVALMFIFDDEASVDFLHLDAMTLTLAAQGKKIPNAGSDATRFIMAPNVLLYFLNLVEKVALELKSKNPSIDRDTRGT